MPYGGVSVANTDLFLEAPIFDQLVNESANSIWNAMVYLVGTLVTNV